MTSFTLSSSHSRARLPDRVVVINDYAYGGGGAAVLARASAAGLKELGIDVLYFAGNAADGTLPGAPGIEVVGLGEKPLAASPALAKGLFNRRAAQQLAAWIARNDTPGTIYHLHNWSHILSPAVFVPLRHVRGRVVLSAHDFFLACPNGAFAHFPTNTVCSKKPLSADCLVSSCDKRNYGHKLWRSLRQAVRNTVYDVRTMQPRVLAIHPGMLAFLQRGGIPPELITVLLNPAVPFCKERVAAEENRDFVYVGRLDYEKGADIAAAAAHEAGVPLHIVGDGPLRQELAARYPSLIFHGQLSKQDIAGIVAKACALVMPTRYPEPFGLVAVEALWSGLPVILSRNAFLAGDIAEKKAGLLFDPGSSDSLAKAMAELASQPDLRKRMSVAALSDTGTLAHTPEAWLQELLVTYQKLLLTSRKQTIEEVLVDGPLSRKGLAS